MGGDQRIASRMLEVIRATSRRKAAARAVHLLNLIEHPNPLVLHDVNVRFVIEQARSEFPEAAGHAERRWHAAVRRHENGRVLQMLRQRLIRGAALTSVASVLLAAAENRG